MTMRSFRHVIVAIYIHSYFRETWTMDGTREEKKNYEKCWYFPTKKYRRWYRDAVRLTFTEGVSGVTVRFVTRPATGKSSGRRSLRVLVSR